MNLYSLSVPTCNRSKMKCATSITVILAMFFVVTQTHGNPIFFDADEDFQRDESDLPEVPPIFHLRKKRATCDLLSWFNFNHAACAAHCIVLGNKGGFCDDKAVCNCRK